MNKRLLRLFGLTWFSFAFFYSTMMPFVLERPTRELLGPGVFAGFFVAVVSTALEWMRLRHKDRSSAT